MINKLRDHGIGLMVKSFHFLSCDLNFILQIVLTSENLHKKYRITSLSHDVSRRGL